MIRHTIFFRDSQVELEVTGTQHLKTEPGWLRVVEWFHDPSFGDMGISYDRDVMMIPADRVSHVISKQVDSAP